MKHAIVGLAALATLNSTGAMAQDDPLKIGAALYGLRAEFAQIMVEAMEAHPAVLSGKVDLTVYDGRYDALVQQDQFEIMITQEFDGILFFPIDVDAGAAAVQEAYDAGIPVVAANARVNSDLLTAYIGSNDVEAGYIEAKSVLDEIGCKGDVVVIEGPIGQSAQIQRLEGNLQALAECPDVTVLERQSANWSRAEAQTLMENWLTAHPGQIEGVIGQNDEMALGAIEAIKGAKLSTDDFAVAGIDGVTDALNAVKADEMSTTLQDGASQALGALDIVINAAMGGGYTPESGIWETYPAMDWAGGTAGEYTVPWTPVTESNVDQLLEMRN
jgi:putative xylitol transport system substrate-binding protein